MDAARGLLMILMALDHAISFICRIHYSEFWAFPMPDYGGSLLAFFTRFVSHLCAPGFAFFMGAGMVLFAESRGRRGWGTSSLVRHFWLRAFVLVGVSLTLENFFWHAGELSTRPDAQWGVFFSILCTLAGSMAAGSFLLRLPALLLMSLSAGFILLAPMALPIGQPVEGLSQALSLPRIVLFVPWGHQTFLGRSYFIYPLVPWLGITLAGMVLGKALAARGEPVLKGLHRVGFVLLLAFLVARFAGIPGNINTTPPSVLIGFLSITKYPPSPAFVFFTLGMNCLLLWFLDRIAPFLGEANALLVFGRVPFFFYILHIGLFCVLGWVIRPAGYTVGYGTWLAGLALLYLPCRCFAVFKKGASPDSLWRLF